MISIVDGNANTDNTETASRILRRLSRPRKYSDFKAKNATTTAKKITNIASVDTLAKNPRTFDCP
jgi:hypothetical protein